MFCPKGYRTIGEVEALAEEIADELIHEEFSGKEPSEGASFDDARKFVTAYQVAWKSAAFRMVDEFLARCSDLFICSKEGLVLRVNKRALLPSAAYFQDEEEYISQRNSSYQLVDTDFWVVDIESLREIEAHEKSVIESLENAWMSSNQMLSNIFQEFNGWAVCVPVELFPPSKEALKKLLVQSSQKSQDAGNIVDKILAEWENGGTSKATIKANLPNLSFRKFEHFWRLAAVKNPEITKPGRKS